MTGNGEQRSRGVEAQRGNTIVTSPHLPISPSPHLPISPFPSPQSPIPNPQSLIQLTND
ncbi:MULTISPECIES: hypothetical protein [Nostoc]|uniref:Uncharacterized protein n=1 Tax=Nostoc paludosum FACHB-159 TaxID=2692908 RepID=A0ABR8KAS0_9NOSO|nr:MULTISPECIES: hypothetical protein [Nostoc]MBD2735978.1 hypothetical protein [Nostoc paludosum FACHB-159]